MLLFALLNASTCFGVYPVVSRAANQTTVVAVPLLCTAGAVVAAAAAVGAAPAGGGGAVPPLVPPPPQATSTPALADITSPFKTLRRLSRACHRRSSFTVPLTPTPSCVGFSMAYRERAVNLATTGGATLRRSHLLHVSPLIGIISNECPVSPRRVPLRSQSPGRSAPPAAARCALAPTPLGQRARRVGQRACRPPVLPPPPAGARGTRRDHRLPRAAWRKSRACVRHRAGRTARRRGHARGTGVIPGSGAGSDAR